MENVIALILAGGEGSRLLPLSAARGKPMLPFGGQFRIVDFVLGNCVNSGLNNLFVLTQYSARELHDHLSILPYPDHGHARGRIIILQPSSPPDEASGWYRGTADAVRQNAHRLRQLAGDTVLVLAADQVYTMDYRPFVDAHRHHHADVTVAVTPVPPADASRFGIVGLDRTGRIVDWDEKPVHPRGNLASMGIYAFSKRALLRWLDVRLIDFGREVIPAMLAAGRRVAAHRYDGYWQDIGTIDSYWRANMDLLDEPARIDPGDPGWPITTPPDHREAARVGSDAQVRESLLGNGSIVHGLVTRSVIGPGVRIGPEAIVRDSVIFGDTVVGQGAVVDRAIIDRSVAIGPRARIGGRRAAGRLQTDGPEGVDLTIVGERVEIHHGLRVRPGARIDPPALARTDGGSQSSGYLVEPADPPSWPPVQRAVPAEA